MPTFDTIAPGTKPIAAYQPIFELGRGGMGTVHLARAVGAGGFERLVVVKRLKQDLVDSPEAVQRFLDEARHAALIHHANVVGIHQIGRDAEGYFLVLDYVEGGSLDDLVRRAYQRNQKVPPSIILRIALDALAGLSAAHTATDPSGRPLNLLHRDVSPQNVLVGRDGVSRLADFGVAKSALASVQTDQRYLVGKLLYLPPEYLARRPVGPTLDIYSLGVTLWTAFCGTEPWEGATEAELVARICQERVPRLGGVGVRIAPQVEDLVMRACDPEPLQRFQSAREMADEVEAMARETGWVASHGEVASLLDDLLGNDLARRRERAASVVASLPRPDASSASTHRSVPPAAEVQEMTLRIPRDEKSEGVEVPIAKTRTPIFVGAGVALVAAAGFYVLGSHIAGDRPNAVSAASAEMPPLSPKAPAEAAESSGSTAVPPAPAASAAPVAPTALDSLPVDHAASPSSRAPAPATTASSRSEPPRVSKAKSDQHPVSPAGKPAQEPVAPVVTPVPAAPKAPDGISKSNPYR